MEIPIRNHSCALFVRYPNRMQFAGTVFYFSHRERVFAATADHCIGKHSGELVIAVGQTTYPAKVAVRDSRFDLCLLEVPEHPDDISLTLSTTVNVPNNCMLYVFEFSTTQVKEGQFHLAPATRIGNCVRIVQMQDVFGLAGAHMLELSFPALRGASGSPVIELRNTQMIAHGIVVANTEHHLLPAHIESVLDEKNEILEERRYYLPQAAAVNSIHLRRIADKVLDGPTE